MFGRSTRTQIAPLLSFCVWTWRTASGYVNIPFSTTYYGIDGPWQAVSVSFGGWNDDTVDSTEWTTVDLLPGGTYSNYILDSSLCSKGSSNLCGTGGTWNSRKQEQTGVGYMISWEPAVDQVSSSGVYGTGPIYAQNMNVNGDDQYTVPNCSTSAIDLGNQTLPNGNQIDLELGFFALGAGDDQYQQFTLGGDTPETFAVNAWVMPGYFYNKSITESYSFSLHLGSTAFNYPGSMLFGGYDKGRAIGPATTYADTSPPLQDIVLGVETGGSPWDFDSKDSLLLTNTSSHDSITVTPEPMVPYLHLPKQTCDNLAKYLPVSKDSSGYYLWNTADPTYKNITTSAAYLGFVFPPATGGTQDVTIKVPFQLLVLNLTVEASGYAGQTPYFPCMPYEPSDGNYLLGRAFLQSAFLGRNWNRHISWLAQAPGPGASRTGLGVQPTDIDDGDTSLDFFPDNGRFAASWSDHWTPLEGSTTNGGAGSGGGSGNGGDDGGLSTGATAGIGVGAAALAVGALGIAAFFLVRRRKHRKASESEQQPFTAAHYGDEAKASPAPHERPQVDQYGQAFNEHQQQYNQQHYGHYEPYKARPPPQQESIPLSELSGTMRNPAQELPAHEPMELEAPFKTNDPVR
ncbi:hypothetical protein LTR37_011051 [Vermiconidia calcicola]|uniref:Uncharacterized protein n=1 Tax=Vermiconidia calcicola TaxID=1690605 RepID=A0ACC3N4P1_9PEZI|nr:hypothetical protein LTR37_011051 [Vermiconidia calcicola]